MLRRAVIYGSAIGTMLSAPALHADTTFEPPALGEMPEDEITLSDSPILSHMAEALGDSAQDMKAADLINQAEKLRFETAPSPTALIEAQTNPPLAPSRVELKLLSYNTGLLSRKKIFGFIGLVEVPEIEARRKALPDILTTGDFDILMLQEVWEDFDAANIARAATENGYVSYHGTADLHSEHGLQILIKKQLIKEGSTISSGEYQYDAQYSLEYWPGPDIKRGAIWVKFEHPELGRIAVMDTHQAAFAEFYPLRMKQARELGALSQHIADTDTLLFVGGDMNAGPYYVENEWTLPDGQLSEVWWANASSYPLMLHYLNAKDLLAMGGTAQDIELGQSVVNFPQESLQVPFGSDSWCKETPDNTFTGTDCNSLYFRNYAGSEYPSRLDHLLVRSADDRVHVLKSQLEFTEEMDFGSAGRFEPSDHYGVSAHVAVNAPQLTPVVTAEAPKEVEAAKLEEMPDAAGEIETELDTASEEPPQESVEEINKAPLKSLSTD